jgi:hypothetical protein
MNKLSLISAVLLLASQGFGGDGLSLEQLLGVSVAEGGMVFHVKSNGCTMKSDFRFDVEESLEDLSPMLPAYEHHYYITVYRQHIDSCGEPMPNGAEIFMSYEELGSAFGKFHVKNPIGQ